MTTELRMKSSSPIMEAVAERERFFTLATLEKFATVALLLFMSGAWFSPVIPLIPASAFRLLGLAMGFLILMRYIPQMIAVLVKELPFTLLLIFCGVQIFWSFAYDHSVEPVILLYLTAFFGLYIAMRYSIEEQLSLVVWWVVLTWFLSFIFVMAFPQYGAHTDAEHFGRWNGLYLQKNDFGIALTVTVVPMLALWRRWGWIKYVLGAGILYAIYASGSATALASSILMILAVPTLAIFRMHSRLIVGMLLIILPIVGIIGIVGIVNYQEILVALGRSPTLTGRTHLWDAAIELILMRPLHGWGLRGSFSEGSPIFTMIPWQGAPYAHNHWIDTTLETGLIGLTLYTLTLVRTLWRSLKYASNFNNVERLYPLVYLIILHVTLLSTQSLLTQFNSTWMFYVAIVYGLSIHDTPLANAPYRRPFPPRKT
jgi:O-antigen ligase